MLLAQAVFSSLQTNLVLRGNHVFDNDGPGLWADGNNTYVLYEDNLIENNAGSGIMHEISFDAIMRNNILRGNGHGETYQVWIVGAGILISHSSDVEAYNNIVEGNRNGISVIQTNRTATYDGRVAQVKNVYVHNNQISMDGGYTGFAISTGLISDWQKYFSSTFNNRFRNNTYDISNNKDDHFHWNGQRMNYIEWQNAGQQ